MKISGSQPILTYGSLLNTRLPPTHKRYLINTVMSEAKAAFMNHGQVNENGHSSDQAWVQ